MCLTCVLLVPSFFSLQHFHPKEAVAAAAAGSEDDFEEKSPSAKSFSLRGAVAVATAAEDAADEDEELIPWQRHVKDWSMENMFLPVEFTLIIVSIFM